MNKTETIIVDVYPWAEPTEEQKKFFDALPPEEKRRMIEQSIKEGVDSGPPEQTDAESIVDEAKKRREHGV